MIPEIVANSWGELQQAANSAFTALGDMEVWFRGHEEPDWSLRPKVFRRFNRPQETKLFGMFQQRAVGLRRRCPKAGDIGNWLCLMQHYGLPTRLLDWSRSLAVAAFFATSWHRGRGDAIIWATSPLGLNAKTLSVPNLITLSHSRLSEVVKGACYLRAEVNLIGAVTVPDIDTRMVVQQSVFTVHGSSLPLECYANADQFLYKIRIPERHRGHFTVAMRQFGIRPTSMFPDLQNLANELVDDELYGGKPFPCDLAAGFNHAQVQAEEASRMQHEESLRRYCSDHSKASSANQ